MNDSLIAQEEEDYYPNDSQNMSANIEEEEESELEDETFKFQDQEEQSFQFDQNDNLQQEPIQEKDQIEFKNDESFDLPDIDLDEDKQLLDEGLKKWQRPWIQLKPIQKQYFRESVEIVDENGKTVDKKNSIIYLETGQGKTVISMMHIYYALKKFQGNKKIIFIAQTIQLVEQQAAEIRSKLYNVAKECEEQLPQEFGRYNLDPDFLKLSDLDNQDIMTEFVIPMHANKSLQENGRGADLEDQERWSRERWEDIINTSEVLVMIGQFLLNALRRGYLKLSEIGLIVIDECHHAKDQNPFRQMLVEFYDDPKVVQKFPGSQEVKIIGLTATPILDVQLDKIKNQQVPRLDSDQFRLELYTLCLNLHSRIVVCDENNMDSQNQIVSQTKNIVVSYEQTMTEPEMFKNFLIEHKELQAFYMSCFDILQNLQELSYGIKVFVQDLIEGDLMTSALTLLFGLGKYSFYQFLNQILRELDKLLELKVRSKKKKDKDVLDKIRFQLESLIKSLKDINTYGVLNQQNLSVRVLRLIEILTQEVQNQDPQIIVFVTSKLTASYLNQLIDDLKQQEKNQLNQDISKYEELSSKFIVGVGRLSDTAHQNRIMNNRNKNVDANMTNITDHIELAKGLLEKFRINSPDSKIKGEEEQKFDQVEEDVEDAYEGGIVKKQSFKGLEFNLKKQMKTIEEFRRKEFKILISTSVVEEGFDIPQCNVVIVFEPIRSFKQYIQQKGRVRSHINPKFYVITDQKKQSIDFDLKIYDLALSRIKCIAKDSVTIRNEEELCQKRSELLRQKSYALQRGIQEEKVYYKSVFVKNHKEQDRPALLNTNWAINILSNYLGYFSMVAGSERNQYFFKGAFYYYVQYPDVGYICIVVLPSNVQHDRVFKGELCSKKSDAKRSAAFEAVVFLRKSGYLQDDLKPRKGKLNSLRGPQKPNLLNDGELKVQTHQDKDLQVSEKKTFKQNMSQVLDFKFTSELPQQIPLEDYFTFKLFQLDFDLKDHTTSQKYLDVNSGQPQQIGLLHMMDFPVQDATFYPHLSKSPLIIRLISTIKLKWEHYLELRKISDYLNCTVMNYDIEYLSIITGMPIKAKGKLDKKSKKQSSVLGLDKDVFSAIFVLIKPDPDNLATTIDHESNAYILQYIGYMKKVYEALNNLYENQMQVKSILNVRNSLLSEGNEEEANKQHIQYLKVPIHEQNTVFFQQMESDPLKVQKVINNYLVQIINDNCHLGKFVVNGIVESNGQLSSLNFKSGLSMQDKSRNLRNVFYKSKFESDPLIVSTVKVDEFLRPAVVEYLERKYANVQSNQKLRYFSGELAKHPLNIKTFFKLTLLVNTGMMLIRDYLHVCHFKNIRLKEKEREANIKGLQTQPYEFKVLDSFILQQDRNLCLYMKKNQQFQSLYQRLQSLQGQKGMQPKYIPKNHPPFQAQNLVESLDDGLLFRAFSTKSYCPNIRNNLEVLEFFGDSVLKVLATVQVFIENPLSMEGFLHNFRQEIIQNSTLNRIALLHKMEKYILTQQQTYIPNNLRLQDESQEKFNHIPDKSLADSFEAMIGVYMKQFRSVEKCQFFLFQMGLLSRPTLQVNIIPLSKSELYKNDIIMNMLQMLENKLQYQFRNKEILLQAITHNSFFSVINNYRASEQGIDDPVMKYVNPTEPHQMEIKEIIDKAKKQVYQEEPEKQYGPLIESINKVSSSPLSSYERLEFLGDAILDFVVVEWLLEKYPQEDQGNLTFRKSSVVQNKSLCLVCIHKEFHKFILHPLVDNHSTREVIKHIEDNIAKYSQDIDQLFGKEGIVKILGDLVESIIGAVFLDSGFDYNLTKSIILSLLGDFLEKFSQIDPSLKRLQSFLSSKGIQSHEIIQSSAPPIYGEREYIFRDSDSLKEFYSVRALTEKDAIEKLLQEKNLRK